MLQKVSTDYPPELICHILDLYSLGKSKRELMNCYNISSFLIDQWISQQHFQSLQLIPAQQSLAEQITFLQAENHHLAKEISTLKQLICLFLKSED